MATIETVIGATLIAHLDHCTLGTPDRINCVSCFCISPGKIAPAVHGPELNIETHLAIQETEDKTMQRFALYAAATCLLVLFSCVTFVGAEPTDSKTKSLFDGHSLLGWHVDVPKMDNNAEVKSPFVIRDGMLVSLGNPRGHLITDAEYQNYRLEVEYRFAAKPGNCGVLVHASKPRRSLQHVPQIHRSADDARKRW